MSDGEDRRGQRPLVDHAGDTAVGGQPPGAPRQPVHQAQGAEGPPHYTPVPVGLEKVLYLAAVDAAFREELLRDRDAAASARGLPLSSSETAMLRLAPTEQLTSAIAALDTSDANLARRGFLRAVAGAVTLAAGSVLAGCGEEATRGIQPDLPSGFDAGGIRPYDLLPHQVECGGIRPGDLPGVDAPNRAGGGIRPDGIGVPDGKK